MFGLSRRRPPAASVSPSFADDLPEGWSFDDAPLVRLAALGQTLRRSLPTDEGIEAGTNGCEPAPEAAPEAEPVMHAALKVLRSALASAEGWIEHYTGRLDGAVEEQELCLNKIRDARDDAHSLRDALRLIEDAEAETMLTIGPGIRYSSTGRPGSVTFNGGVNTGYAHGGLFPSGSPSSPAAAEPADGPQVGED